MKDLLVDLEHACQLGEQELATLTRAIDQSDTALIEHRAEMQKLMNQLNKCKTDLIATYDSCSVNDDRNIVDKKGEREEKRSLRTIIATGCDWLIRAAGVIWALQLLYGYL